jgi:hypothetical protein
MGAQLGERAHWRGKLRRELAGFLVLKALALVLIWALFFSSDHRLSVNAAATDRRLGIASVRTELRQQPPGPARQDTTR